MPTPSLGETQPLTVEEKLDAPINENTRDDYSTDDSSHSSDVSSTWSVSLSTDESGTNHPDTFFDADTVWVGSQNQDGTTIDSSQFTYQWYSSDSIYEQPGAPITGATERYLPLEDYVGTYVSCQVTSKLDASASQTIAVGWIQTTEAVAPSASAYREESQESSNDDSLASDWPGYRGPDGTNVTTTDTPTKPTGADWVQLEYMRQGTADMSGISEPILVGGKVFIAVGNEIRMLNASTGETEITARLAASICSTCRMVYASGAIVVPLDTGILQALTPDKLTTLWVTDPVDESEGQSDQQSLSTLTVHEGFVYAGTTDAGKSSGCLRCISLADGSVSWSYSSSTSSYYWSGGAITGAGLVIAQNSGKLDLMSLAGKNGSGEVLSSIQLPSQVSSTVVASEDGTTVYVMGYDGTLYKVAVREGSLHLERAKKLCRYSVSTPTLLGDRLYVGGSALDSMRNGGLYVVDADTLESIGAITRFDDDSGIGGPISCSPLVAIHDGGTYVYFTANDARGGIYLYVDGESWARHLFIPAASQRQYTLSSIAVDSEGALYYINDSGNLFKVSGNSNPASDEEDHTGLQTGGGSNQGASARQTSSSADLTSSTENLTDSASGSSTSPLGILAGEDSGRLQLSPDTNVLLTDSKDTDDTHGSPSNHQLPLWPIIGMAIGAAAAAAAPTLNRIRRKANETA